MRSVEYIEKTADMIGSDANELPVPVYKICRRLGIKVWISDFGDISHQYDGFFDFRKSEIYLNRRLGTKDSLFTCAYLLGAYVMNTQEIKSRFEFLPSNTSGISEKQYFKDLNLFARCILIPKNKLEFHFSRGNTREILCAAFNVSLATLNDRIKEVCRQPVTAKVEKHETAIAEKPKKKSIRDIVSRLNQESEDKVTKQRREREKHQRRVTLTRKARDAIIEDFDIPIGHSVSFIFNDDKTIITKVVLDEKKATGYLGKKIEVMAHDITDEINLYKYGLDEYSPDFTGINISEDKQKVLRLFLPESGRIEYGTKVSEDKIRKALQKKTHHSDTDLLNFNSYVQSILKPLTKYGLIGREALGHWYLTQTGVDYLNDISEKNKNGKVYKRWFI